MPLPSLSPTQHPQPTITTNPAHPRPHSCSPSSPSSSTQRPPPNLAPLQPTPRPHPTPPGSGTTPNWTTPRPRRPRHHAHTRHNPAAASGLDLLRVFEYGVTATELSLPGAIGGSYLDGGTAGGMAAATGMAGGLGGSGVPWRRPLSGSDGYVSCPQCQKPITSYNLNRHVRMVHSNMEHATCPVCCKEFKNKYSLATHLHRQHAPHAPAPIQPQAVPQPPAPPHHLAAPPTSTC